MTAGGFSRKAENGQKTLDAEKEEA